MSDPLRVLAGGVGTFDNDKTLLDRLAGLVEEHHVTLVVVGMPYAPDGGKGAKGREVELFIHRMESAIPVTITTWDESFSSVDAQRTFRQGGMKRKQRQEKGRVDEMAARLMLQEYLDTQPEKASPE
jgi:putative Holliday junction resolvase